MCYVVVFVMIAMLMLTSHAAADNQTPFDLAIAKNDLEAVKKLAADGEIKYELTPFPLRLAVLANAKEVAEWLVANGRGVDFYGRDDNGQLPLDVPPGQELNAARKVLREINSRRNELLGLSRRARSRRPSSFWRPTRR